MAAVETWMRLFCLAAVCCCGYGQGYQQRSKINLCEKLPNVEPNGEHLGRPGDKIIVYTNWTDLSQTSVNRCLMRFSTCDYCRLRVNVINNFDFRSCPSSAPAYIDDNGSCAPGCTYLHLYDQDYSNQTAKSFSNEALMDNYATESRFLYVIACSNKSMTANVLFNITVTSEDKAQVFKGSSIHRPGTFHSPFFPDAYVLNSEIYRFIFQAATQDEFVTISFDDWHLSSLSTIIFDDANVIGVIQGSALRPWIISNKYRLTMTFETGPYRIPGTFRMFTGFKATYSYHASADRSSIPYVVTSCGERITMRESGNITFNPTSNGHDYYDCIWVIQKEPHYEKIMVKVVNFSTRETTYRVNQPNNILEIRDGLTSQGILRANAVPSSSPDDIQTFYPHDSDVGFYVRLKGHYSGRRDFVLVYTSFNYDQCRNKFVCRNNKCIARELRCNGIDNCGDNSDEAYSECGSSGPTSGSNSRNTLSVGIIIPIVIFTFLIVVIGLLIIFILRCRRLSRQARRSQRHRHVNTVSDSVSGRRRHNRRRGPRGGTGGGSHDLPPSYEEVLSTTPIGYLNLGFADGIPASEISLIQPPSYEEATSPTESAPPFSLTASHSHDLSSDSSSLETVNRSHHHLSISDSSDDSQAGREQRRHQHRRNMSSSSSDSSVELRFEVEGQGSGGGRGEGGVNSQGDGLERPNTRHSIAKPDEGNSTESAVSTTNNLTNKDGQQKPENGTQPPRGKRNKRNNSTTPTIITQDLSPAAVAVPTRVRDSGDRGPSNRSSREIMCRLEESPVVLAPAFLGAAQQRRPAPDAALSRPSAHAGRQGASQGRPAEQTAPHVRRDPRTHKPQRTPMKLLSRSMDDVRMHVEDCPGQSFPSSRPFSQSVENICEWSGDSAGGDPHRHAPVDLAQSRPYQSRESPPRRSGSGNDSRHADGRQYRQEMPSVGENRPRPVPRPRKLLEGTGQNANSRHRDSHERESSHPSTRQLSQSSSPPHVTHSLDRSVQRPDVSHEPQSRAAPHRNTASLDRHVNPEQWGSRSPSRSERQTSHCDPDAAASPSKREKQSMPGASPKPYGDSDNAQRMRQYDARDRSERYSDKDQSSRNNDRKEDWSSVSTVPGQHGSDSGRRQKTPIPSQISQALNQPGAGWDRSSAAPNSAWARLKPGGERSRPAEPPTTPQVHSPPRVNSAQAKHAPVHPASGQSRSRGETEVGAEHQSHGSDTSGLPASPRHQDPVVQDSAEMPSSSPVRIVGSYGMNNPVMYSLQLAGGEEDDVYV